ncbi:MAG: hypothetical protein FP824_07720 [Euryarchaeota archaeon]|nr:hypothetical protein [Euryarchaeota archaeon]MBU4032271.1 hypothetical protein [Candidatus Thermoplasmatota archaeon]
MSGKCIHKRRVIVQPSFPNNRFSTRPRRKKVVKRQEWREEESSAYFGVPNSAVFNPLANAPTFPYSIQHYDTGLYAPVQPLRACDWGDGQEASGGAAGGGCVQHGGVYVNAAQPISGTEIGRPCGIGLSQGVRGRGYFEEMPQVASQCNGRAPVATSYDGAINYTSGQIAIDDSAGGWNDWIWNLTLYTYQNTVPLGVNVSQAWTDIGSTPEGYNITKIGTHLVIVKNVTLDYSLGTWQLTLYYYNYVGAASGDMGNQSPVQAYANSSREIWGGLSPTSNDTDGDGLYDGPNVDYTYTLDKKNHIGEESVGTDPLNPDTDGDSANDGQEFFGYDLVWMSIGADGTVTEHYENGTRSNPLDARNAWRDLDKDGISDYNETHYADAYPAIVEWANTKRAEWEVANQSFQAGTSTENPPEFNATEYLSNQFNAFVKENIPPMITNVVIDTKESWGWSWGVWHCEHAWAEIDVSILDVAPYNLWIGVTDRGTYLFFSGTGGQYEQVHHAVIDLDYWADVAAEYYVNVTAWDAANNIAYYEKEVAGFFGGIMNFLEDVWNAVAGAFSAAWEAVKGAVNILGDIIMEVIEKLINPIIDPIKSSIDGYISRITLAANNDWNNALAIINSGGSIDEISLDSTIRELMPLIAIIAAIGLGISIAMYVVDGFAVALPFLIPLVILFTMGLFTFLIDVPDDPDDVPADRPPSQETPIDDLMSSTSSTSTGDYLNVAMCFASALYVVLFALVIADIAPNVLDEDVLAFILTTIALILGLVATGAEAVDNDALTFIFSANSIIYAAFAFIVSGVSLLTNGATIQLGHLALDVGFIVISILLFITQLSLFYETMKTLE